jgi:hypothetical protein
LRGWKVKSQIKKMEKHINKRTRRMFLVIHILYEVILFLKKKHKQQNKSTLFLDFLSIPVSLVNTNDDILLIQV